MYTKSNRKSGSANSLAWFPPYSCFRFRLQGLPNAIFRRFSTFRRRLARVVPRAMLKVPFLGTLPVGDGHPNKPTFKNWGSAPKFGRGGGGAFDITGVINHSHCAPPGGQIYAHTATALCAFCRTMGPFICAPYQGPPPPTQFVHNAV